MMLCIVVDHFVTTRAKRITFLHVARSPSHALRGGPHPFLDTENQSALATELHKTVASAMKAYCQVRIMYCSSAT